MEEEKQYDDELVAAIDKINKLTIDQWRTIVSDWTGANKLMVKLALKKDTDERKYSAKTLYALSIHEEIEESRALLRFHTILFSLSDDTLKKIIATFPEMN